MFDWLVFGEDPNDTLAEVVLGKDPNEMFQEELVVRDPSFVGLHWAVGSPINQPPCMIRYLRH
jgi:hypothetical protein